MKSRTFKAWAVLAAGVVIPVAIGWTAPVRHYAAHPENSDWALESSRRACRLVHHIPVYGRAVFLRPAGEELQFRLELDRSAGWDGALRLRAEPPAWKHGVDGYDIAMLDDSPFPLRGQLAQRMLAELEQGMYPTMYYRDWAGTQRDVRVSVSAVNFRPALERFLTCTENLWPLSIEQAADLSVHFAPGAAALGPGARERLDMAADYLKHGSEAIEVRIAGHTDAVGHRRDNFLLSQRRAVAVRDYLVKAGVARSRLRIGFHGEAKPVDTNDTARGRARNRRVRIQVLR